MVSITNTRRNKLVSFMAAWLLMGVCFHAHAQQANPYVLTSGGTLPGRASSQLMEGYDQNIAKINLLALPLRNISLQYERMVSRKISVALGYRLMPKGQFPMLNSFESLIDDEETFNQLKDISIGSNTITPEVRFYFGKHGGPRGFYVAPYGSYSSYSLGFENFEYTVELEDGNGNYYEETRSMALSGRVNGFTGGVLFGAQWRIGQWVYLDWWILGPAYGAANGKLTGAIALDAEEQRELREELEGLEIPLVKTEAYVDANGARLDIKGPWAGVRAGLAVGIKF